MKFFSLFSQILSLDFLLIIINYFRYVETLHVLSV